MAWFTVNNLIPLFCVVAGLVMIYVYFRNQARVAESAAWPASQGTVVEARVREDTTSDSDGFTSSDYYPEVRYVYHVLGNEYEGTKIMFGPQSGGGQRRAMAVIAKYPKDSRVTVYYDPEQPSRAVLERSTSKTLLGYGVIFIAIGIYLAIKLL